MAEHTNGRLTVIANERALVHYYVADSLWIATVHDETETDEGCGVSPAEADANARRLAACWNACLGVDTVLLENGVAAKCLEVLRPPTIEQAEAALKALDGVDLPPLSEERIQEIVSYAVRNGRDSGQENRGADGAAVHDLRDGTGLQDG